MSSERRIPAESQPSSMPRRIAKVGFLAALLSAGALEFVSFIVFGCPCLGQPWIAENTAVPPQQPAADSNSNTNTK